MSLIIPNVSQRLAPSMVPAPRTTPIRTPVSPSTRTVKFTSTNSPPPPRAPFSGPPASPSQTLPVIPSLLHCKRPVPQARLSVMVLASSRTRPLWMPLPLAARTHLHPSMPRLPVVIVVPSLPTPTVRPLLRLLSPAPLAPTMAAAMTTTTHNQPLSIRQPPNPRSLKKAAHFRTSTPRASASLPPPFFAALCSSESDPSSASVQSSSYSPYRANFVGSFVQMSVRHNLRSDLVLSSAP